MEKTTKSWVFESSFGWSDLGTWHSLYSFLDKDSKGNMVQAKKVMLERVKGNMIVSKNDGKLIVISGLENFMVVDTDDVLMICPKDETAFKNVITDLMVNDKSDYQ